MRKSVEEALNLIRPNLQADGGDVELVDVHDGVVTVRLTGAFLIQYYLVMHYNTIVLLL